jgi:GH43 family beta-xylosidase
MNANPILLQMKYARVVSLFAKQTHISLDEALSFFYASKLYQLLKKGSSDIHCMSDLYLAEDLQNEFMNVREIAHV